MNDKRQAVLLMSANAKSLMWYFALIIVISIVQLSVIATTSHSEDRIEWKSNKSGSVPGPQVSVERVLGVPTFVVDETSFTSPCFETYKPEEKYFRQFADAGVKVFSFNTNAAACDYRRSRPSWTAPTTWDYSHFEKLADRVLRANPNAMLLPRVYLGTPQWWIESNRAEWELLEDGASQYDAASNSPTQPHAGPFPSLASKKWRAEMGDSLRRFIDHLQQSKYGPHIFGYLLVGLHTEEWYHWSAGLPMLSGYSEPTRLAFQEWLRRKYRTAEALRTAWKCDEISFETVVVPAPAERRDEGHGTFRDPAQKMNVIDFYLFYNELIPDTIDHFAAIARKETKGQKALGAFYGFMYEFGGNPEFGHNALAKYNESPNLDFVFVTASYSGREFGSGGDALRGPAYSVQLHDKLWYHDNDVISFLGKERLAKVGMKQGAHWSRNLDHYVKVLGYTETPQQSKWMYRRGVGFCICNGAYYSYFDLHGGYYDDPELMDEVRALNRVAELSKRYDRRSCSEILVVADEASNAYATFNSNLLSFGLTGSQKQFVKLGAPQDHVLLSDLDRVDALRYKLVIFLNCFNVTDTQRSVIDEKLKRDGRTLVWCYAPGLFNGPRSDASQMHSLTGMKIEPSEDRELIELSTTLRDADYPLNRIMLKKGEKQLDVADRGRGQLFRVKGDDVQKLGVATAGLVNGRDEITLARKEMDDWISIYSWSPTLPAAAWREIAREAGVHIFSEQDDTFYANANFLSIHANGAGRRTLRLPWKANVMDMTTEQVKWPNTQEFTHDFQNGETLILKWRPWL